MGGHPDKLCDQVSDSVLDTCLRSDPKSKVACETATKDNMVAVMGEITTKAKLDYNQIVRAAVAKIGFDSYVDDLSSVDSKGLSDQTCEVLVRINKQSPDIAGGVHVGKDDLDCGAGDQGIMFGYATDETEDCMPLTHSLATKLGKKLTDVRKSGDLWWLRPDGKTQVTIEYKQKADGSVEPQKIHTVVISTQHAEPSKAVRTKECAGYTGPEMTAPSMEEMNKLIVEEVVKETLKEITLKNGQSALSLFVETYGTEQGALTAVDITNIIKIAFDCRPGAIAMSLALREPKYQETAAYCHFGRQAETKNGIKFFEWENAKDLSKYKAMDSAQVEAALKSSNYLTKWVD